MLTTQQFTRWITALSDGSYRKGKGKLRHKRATYTEWCCLGVLCDLDGIDLDMPARPETALGDLGGVDEGEVTDLGILRQLTYDQRDSLATVNDHSDTFVPVVTWLLNNRDQLVQPDPDGE